MAALATVEVQHQRAENPKQVRISAKVKRAIEEMVDNSRKRSEAAEVVGLTDDALYRALTKPEVLAYRAQRLRVLRESAAARTIAKAEQLMDGAESEHVQADMTKWLAGIEGISPVNRSESLHIHAGDVPGIVLTFISATPAIADVQVIDGQSHEVIKPTMTKHLETRVPHPSERNAANLASTPPPGKGTGGAKS